MKRFILFCLLYSPVKLLLAQERIPRYDNLEPFQEGLAMVAKGNGYGFIDRDFKEVVSPVYFSAHSFSEGVAAVAVDQVDGVFTWIFIDKMDKQAVPGKYQSDWPYFKDGIATVRKDGKLVVINKKGEVIFTPKDSVVSPFEHGMAVNTTSDNKRGVINFKGEVIIPAEFDRVEILSPSLVQVTNDKWQSGFYNSNGQKLTSLVYGKVDTLRNGLVRVESNRKFGLFTKEGKALVPAVYDEILDFQEGLSPVRKEEKWGFVDMEGKEVVETKYNRVDGFVNGKSYVSGNFKHSFISKKGKPVKDSYTEFEMPKAKTKEDAEKLFLEMVNALAQQFPTGDEGPAMLDSAFTIQNGILLGSFREYTTSGLIIRKISIPIVKITSVWYDANMGVRVADDAGIVQSTPPGEKHYEKQYATGSVHLASPNHGSHGYHWKEKLELALKQLKSFYS